MSTKFKNPTNKIQITKPYPSRESTGEKSELFDPTAYIGNPADARLLYKGGLMITDLKVYIIFWGPSFTGVLNNLAIQIIGFFKTILNGALMDQLAEYNTANYQVGKGTYLDSAIDPTPCPPVLSDAEIQARLKFWLDHKVGLPEPDQHTLYFIYLESGVQVTMGGESSCTNFCGYHSNIGDSTFYAVIPYPDCAGCLGNNNVFDAITGTSSHELCEAITDPIPYTGWYDDNNNMEIGDICGWQFKKVDGYNVQLEWSNQNNSCR